MGNFARVGCAFPAPHDPAGTCSHIPGRVLIGGQFCDFIYRGSAFFLAARRFEIGDWSRPPANGDDRTRLITYGTGCGRSEAREARLLPDFSHRRDGPIRRRAREPGAEFIAHGSSCRASSVSARCRSWTTSTGGRRWRPCSRGSRSLVGAHVAENPREDRRLTGDGGR